MNQHRPEMAEHRREMVQRLLVSITLCAALLLAPGCSSDQPGPDEDTPEFDHAGVASLATTTRAATSNVAFGRPYGLFAMEAALWVADATGDPFLFQLARPELTMVRALGRLGEGPGDFKAATDLSARPTDPSAVWVFDVTTKRMTRIPLAETEGSTTLPPLSPQVIHAVWLSPNRIIGITRSDSARFMFFDSLANPLQIASGRLLGPDSIPAAVRSRVSGAVKVCSEPGGGRVAVLYLAAGRIEIVDSLGVLQATAAAPYPSDGDFAYSDSSRSWIARAPRNYYANCTVAGGSLLALFSGRRLKDFTGQEASDGRFVHVFDWSGNLKAVLALDHAATSIAVGQDGTGYITSITSDTVFSFAMPRVP